MSLDKKSKMVIIIVSATTLLLLVSGLGYQKFSKSNKIKTFNKYITDSDNNLSQCDFGEDKEGYDDLVAKCKQAIIDKNIEKIDELQPKLQEIQEKIINKNKDTLNNALEQVKKVDISILNQDRKLQINNKVSEIDGLIDIMQFETANSKIEELKKKEKEIILDQKLDNIDKLIKEDKRSEARKSIKDIVNETLNEEQKGILSTYKNKAEITPKEACIIGITKVFGGYKYVTPVKMNSSKFTMQDTTWSGEVAQLDTSDEPKQFLFSTKPFDKDEVTNAEKMYDNEHSSWMIVYPEKEYDGSYKISGRYYNVVITPANGGDIVFDGSKGFHNGYIMVYPDEEIYVDGTVNRAVQ
ncbi:hypothetical protein ACUH7Y_19295 [Clostridium beijerinckii]|uniref:Uncharacterized protein n=1 Tax=Clostridium beijerinckii TaxID=1520 RepID=A0A7X9SS90_CLOBE|nr:hypothetical protein [Clostridium beijerinckii]NMF07116.1 hypothetical protein [Clostridium beijerinckii]